MLGGSLNIRSGPGQGTALEIEVLLPEAAGVSPLGLTESPRIALTVKTPEY